MLRNFEPLFLRLVGTILVVWLLAGGGLLWVLDEFTGSLKQLSAKNGAASLVEKPTTTAVESPKRVGQIAGHVNGQAGPVPRGKEDEATKLQRRVDDAERSLAESFAIGLLTDQEVTFRGGYSYRVGESIDFGPYKGRSVEVIDWGRRAVRLSDGTWLRMAVTLNAGGRDGLHEPGKVLGSPPLAGRSSGTDVR